MCARREPDPRLASRVAAAFRCAASIPDAGPVWETLLREKQARLGEWLAGADVDPLAKDLAAFGRSEAAQGFFGGAGQHRKCEADPAFAQLLAAWTYDKLLSLAEAIGAVRLELPETGSWGQTIQLPAKDLWTRIQDQLGVDLSPPPHVGGYLGIKAGDVIIQMRVVEAIYAAFDCGSWSKHEGCMGASARSGLGLGSRPTMRSYLAFVATPSWTCPP